MEEDKAHRVTTAATAMPATATTAMSATPATAASAFARPENEDDDGYDPWSDRREEPPLFEEDPWS